MGLPDKLHFDSLVNEAESFVLAEMRRQLPAHPEMCTCEECLTDIAAYALNHVPPRYRVSLLDRVTASDAAAYARQVHRAVADAIQRIRANPSHD